MEAPSSSEAPLPTKPPERSRFSSVIVCVILSISLPALVYLLVVGILADVGRVREGNKTVFCCPDFASHLIKAANFTLNPCTNYNRFVCYNWEALRKGEVDNQSLLAFRRLGATGQFHTPAGQFIFSFHRSCLFTFNSDIDLPREAMAALLNVTGLSKTASSATVLKVLIQLSLVHKLQVPVQLFVNQLEGQPSTINIYPNLRDPGFLKRTLVFEAVLNTFNQILQVRVKKEDVLKLQDALKQEELGSPHCGESVLLLDTLVAGVSHQEWIAMIGPFHIGPTPTSMCYSRLKQLKQIFFTLTTNAGRREVQLALLFVLGSVHLLRKYVHEPEATHLFLICEKRTNSLLPMWRVVANEQLTDPKKDLMVQGLFTATKEAVTSDVLKLLHHTDEAIALALLSTVRLVLSKELTPDDIAIPEAGTNYYLNTLKMDLYELTVNKRIAALLNLSGFEDTFLQTSIQTFHNGITLLPALMYVWFRFGDNVEPAINAGAVAVNLAFKMWSIVFDFENWSTASFNRIQEHVDCSSVGSVSQDRLDHTKWRLSLKSASASVRSVGEQWNLPLRVWSFKRLSRAQIFYMTFAAKDCDRWTEIGWISEVLASIRDFRETYSCPFNLSKAINCSLDY